MPGAHALNRDLLAVKAPAPAPMAMTALTGGKAPSAPTALPVKRSTAPATAPAPAPMTMTAPVGAMAPTASTGARPTANGVFIVTVPVATFHNSTAIYLSGVPNVTQWVQYPPKPAAGSFIKAAFFSKKLAGASGKWIEGPQALLSGFVTGNASNIIVQLNAPIYDAVKDMVTLAYKVLPANESSLPTASGIANSVLGTVASASVGGSGSAQLLTAATPGLTLYNATLFIDAPDIANYTAAAASSPGEKAGLIRIPLGFGYGYGYGYDYYVGDPYYYP
ncbi:g10142 [Coccomyxa elongata]